VLAIELRGLMAMNTREEAEKKGSEEVEKRRLRARPQSTTSSELRAIAEEAHLPLMAEGESGGTALETSRGRARRGGLSH